MGVGIGRHSARHGSSDSARNTPGGSHGRSQTRESPGVGIGGSKLLAWVQGGYVDGAEGPKATWQAEPTELASTRASPKSQSCRIP